MVLEPCPELERKAMHGEEMPDPIPAPLQLWYLSMRILYREYKSGKFSKEQAQQEKEKILRQYRMYNELFQDTKRLHGVFRDRLEDTYNDRRLFTEMARRNASAEELLPIACRIARAVTGDESIKETER